MKELWRYLASRRRVAAAAAVCAAVFAASFALYSLPMRALLYPALLSLAIAAAFGTRGFLRFREQRRQVAALRGIRAAELPPLPPARDAAEEEWRSLARELCGENRALADGAAARHAETVEYYTTWAHQVKTPIASMRLALRGEDSPLSRRVSADLTRIEQYVDMVLAYLRLDPSASDYVFRETDVGPIVRGAVKRFADEFIDRRIRLELGDIGIRAVTDEKWLGFVIGQVLSNALKYTREGSVRVFQEGGATLVIADTGIGIAPEDLPRVFEKGFTGRNGRGDAHASGLGLYLCRRVCANLGAAIEARSPAGGGTEVRIRLEQYPLRAE